MWQRHWGGDPGVLGKSLRMFDADVTIAPDAQRICQPWEARAGVMIPKRGSSCGPSCRRTNVRSAELVMRDLHRDFLVIASHDVAS
jgi:hypothetical protein